MGEPYTIPYKQVADVTILVDVYPPEGSGTNPNSTNVPTIPAVVYFHGGGLTAGNRRTWVARWMQSQCFPINYSGHDI